MSRKAVERLSEETLAAIRGRRDAGETPQEIAKALGLGVSTVYHKLAQMKPKPWAGTDGDVFAREQATHQSLRDGILEELETNGPADDTDDLIARMRFNGRGRANVSAHEVQHVLHALRKQGRVSFRGDQNGTVVLLKAISARGVSAPEESTRQTEGVASSVALPQGPDTSPQPEAATEPRAVLYPELASLRSASVRSERYLQAAALLEGVPGADATVAELILEAENADNLTAAEREYLRFAADHHYPEA